jgi:hypothetical protein
VLETWSASSWSSPLRNRRDPDHLAGTVQSFEPKWMARAAIVRHLVNEPAVDAVTDGRRRRGEIEAGRRAVGVDHARSHCW